MADVGTNEVWKSLGKGFNKYLIISLFGLAGVSLAAYEISASITPQPNPIVESTPIVGVAAPVLENAPKIDQFETLINTGTSMRTPQDIKMFSDRNPGIDLTFAGNKTVEEIRKIPDPLKRILAAIGFLDVNNSGRYYWIENGNRVYTCNVYALDLLRELLGNDVIGSRYNKFTGEPSVFGLNQISQKEQYEEVNLALNSNNLDAWMQIYGSEKYGWLLATTQEQLVQLLGEGYIGLAVTKQENVDPKTHPGAIGHALVVAYDKASKEFIISQSTDNIEAKKFPYDSPEPKVNPNSSPYNFWAHKLTEFK